MKSLVFLHISFFYLKWQKPLKVLLFLFVFYSASISFSRDVESTREIGGASLQKRSYELINNKCPKTLEDWVNDDFKDKWRFVSFKSSSKTCQDSVNTYRDSLTKNNLKPQFTKPSQLANVYSEKLTSVVSAQNVGKISLCNSLPNDKATVAQARFYNASAKFSEANKQIMDELAFIDANDPNSNGFLNDMDCKSEFSEVSIRCSQLKSQKSQCQQSQEEQVKNLITKTQDNLKVIRELDLAQQACVKEALSEKGALLPGRGARYSESAKKKIKENCDPIGAALEIRKSQTPWTSGKEFKSLVVSYKSQPRNGVVNISYDTSEETIRKAIALQFSANRKNLAQIYRQNETDFKCLTENNVSYVDCDFKKIRTRTVELPDAKYLTLNANETEKEAKTFLEAENCLLETGEAREKKIDTIDNVAIGVGALVFTGGLGFAVNSARVLNTFNTLARFKNIVNGINVGINAGVTTHQIHHTHQTCKEETNAVIDYAKQNNLEKENICLAADSSFSKIQDAESSCLVEALLTLPSVIPYLGGVQSLKSLLKDAKWIKNKKLNRAVDKSSPPPVSSTANVLGEPVDVYKSFQFTRAEVPTISFRSPDIQIIKVEGVNGAKAKHFFRETVQDDKGVYKNMTRELHFDELTGAIDANLTSSRLAFEKMVMQSSGKAHLVTVDLANLGVANAAGKKAGNAYIKAFADSVMKKAEGKVTLARTGGDEFTLLIHEKDPEKVVKLLNEIRDDFTDKTGVAKKVFTNQKKSLVTKLKKDPSKENMSRVLAFSKTQYPMFSVGSTEIGAGENLTQLMIRSESQGNNVTKIPTTLANGRPALKYGNTEDPSKVPRPLFKAEIPSPVKSANLEVASGKTQGQFLPPPNFAYDEVTRVRAQEIIKVDGLTISEYKTKFGEVSTHAEKWVMDPKTKKPILESTHELPTRASTGLLDGANPMSEKIIVSSLKEGNVILKTKFSNLHEVNYFEEGTTAGNEILKVFSKALKQTTREGEINFSVGGKDFLTTVKNPSPQSLKMIQDRITQKVLQDPKLKEIIATEKRLVGERLQKAMIAKNEKEIAFLKQKITNIEYFKPKFEFYSVDSKMLPKNFNMKNVKAYYKKVEDEFKNQQKAAGASKSF